ncbi:MAG: extracellular solute-binding protein, partial [Caldilineaceae bacterium]
MSKRLTMMLSLLAVIGLLIGACAAPAAPAAPAVEEPAAEAPAEEAAAPAEEAAAPAEEAAAEGETSVRWRTRPDNQEEIDVYQSISDELDAAWDGVTLVYEPGGSETASYQDVLKTEIAAGTAPDVFWIPGTDIADFASRGLILNMADM